jgi:hypothetical protein
VKSWKIRPCPLESDADWHRTNHQWNLHHDKYEAAVAAEMGRPMMGPLLAMFSGELTSGEDETQVISDEGEQSKRGVTSPAKEEAKKLFLFSGESPKQFDAAKGFLNNEKFVADNCPITNGPRKFIGKANATDGKFIANGPIEFLQKMKAYFAHKMTLLSTKTMRRILAAKESIHKYGVFVPRNDREADSSPEAVRWASGRQLEWLKLQEQGTFERNWDWVRLRKAYPSYQKRDVGHVFFVYDHKHSGEHRVRLVFDGSRQNPETCTDTYAPTARGESVRLFHVFAVEEGWTIAQFDVPQAFLKSEIDCVLFVYPPSNFCEFQGQLLKLRLSLYGAKQSAALWNQMIDGFLRGLGFSPSPMDPCLYKRSDAIIILFCDDLRVAGLPDTVLEIKAALFKEFAITTSDGTRFLGMDTQYDLAGGYLKLHMETYIIQTHERFVGFEISRGVPFREIVGCLLWICFCVMGQELLRVKDLARRSNDYTESDYSDALKVLERIYVRRTHGIIFLRGGAGKEVVPANSREGVQIQGLSKLIRPKGDDDTGIAAGFNELRE